MGNQAQAEAEYLARLPEIDCIAALGSAEICDLFQEWPDQFYANLYLQDLSAFPALSRLLPKMASNKDQLGWCGVTGAALMKQSVAFTRSVKLEYERLAEKQLSAARVLDYGAGWGRLTRLFLKYLPVRQLKACDGWPHSIALFGSLNFPIDCDLVPEEPQALPYEPGTFDLIVVFSVFTHLSEQRRRVVLAALRTVLADDGVLAVTTRPRAIWEYRADPEMLALFDAEGCAYRAHDFNAGWGDVAMSLGHIEKTWKGLEIVSVHTNAVDPHQRLVFLKKI